MLTLSGLPLPLLAGAWSGSLGVEARYFPDPALDSRQHAANGSLNATLDYSTDWDAGSQLLDASLFLRADQGDKERSHADIRELLWSKASDSWELRAGIGRVFWGVTESNHLVDIINQTDGVENLDGEDKLGQPMVNLALIKPWGTLDLFMLPGFRERTFAGVEGRPRPHPFVDATQTTYESDQQQRHIDYALRWSHAIDSWDIGLSAFRGTNREPQLTPILGGATPVLAPHYQQISQLGLALQGTFDAWLWKLELIQRSHQQQRYRAATVGVEYSLYSLHGSSVDLGIITEYLYDSRGDAATSPFEDDLLVGARMVLNDEASSELLIGHIIDGEGAVRSVTLEASRRLGDSSKLMLESRFYTHTSATDLSYALRQDDYLQIEWAYYY